MLCGKNSSGLKLGRGGGDLNTKGETTVFTYPWANVLIFDNVEK